MKFFENTSLKNLKIKGFYLFFLLKSFFILVFFCLFCCLKAQEYNEFTEKTQNIKKNIIYKISIIPNYNNLYRIAPNSIPVLENLSKILKKDTAISALIYNSTNRGNIDFNYKILKHQTEAINKKLTELGLEKNQVSFFNFYEKNKIEGANILTELIFIDKKEIINSKTIKDSIKRDSKSDSLVKVITINFPKNRLSKKDSLEIVKTLDEIQPKQRISISISGSKKSDLVYCKKVLEKLINSTFCKVNFRLYSNKSFNYIPIQISVINTNPENIYLTEKDIFLKNLYNILKKE